MVTLVAEKLHQVMLDTLGNFLTLHKDHSYFYWWFFNTLSHHTYEPVARADLDIMDFFKKHFDNGENIVRYQRMTLRGYLNLAL